jgi:hypothetical protein
MANPWSIKNEVSNCPPDGTYKLRIDAIEPSIAKSSGGDQLAFKCEIVSGDLEGKKYTYYRSLQPTGLGFLARDLANSQIFDLDSEEANAMPSNPSELARMLDNMLAGKVFMFDCVGEVYNGTKRPRWTLAGPTGSI